MHKKFCAVHISGWVFRPALLNAEIKALGIHGHFQGCCDTATPVYNLVLNTGLLFTLKFSFVLQSALFCKERGEAVIRFSRISADEQMQAQLSWNRDLHYSVCIPEEVVKEKFGTGWVFSVEKRCCLSDHLCVTYIAVGKQNMLHAGEYYVNVFGRSCPVMLGSLVCSLLLPGSTSGQSQPCWIPRDCPLNGKVVPLLQGIVEQHMV